MKRDLFFLHQVRLSRQPTPFPKDIREKITQFRHQAIAKGHVTGHHHIGDHMTPQHPYRPADEVEAKLHVSLFIFYYFI